MLFLRINLVNLKQTHVCMSFTLNLVQKYIYIFINNKSIWIIINISYLVVQNEFIEFFIWFACQLTYIFLFKQI